MFVSWFLVFGCINRNGTDDDQRVLEEAIPLGSEGM